MYSQNALVCWRMVTSTCVFLLLWLSVVHAKDKSAKPMFNVTVEARSVTKMNESIYCTPSTFSMAACSYSGASFPGDSAVDSVIRSRFLDVGVPFQWDGGKISASSGIPGLAPDAIMQHKASNFYLSHRKILRATAYLDHFLCSDGDCTKMLDIFWHSNASVPIPRALSRFSYIPGTRYALPIWSFGKDTSSPKCKLSFSKTEESKYFKMDAKVEADWRCHWEIPSGAEVISTSPFMVSTQYAAKSFVGKLGGLADISYGNFLTQEGCVTLIIPVDDKMKAWGWTSDDGCESPKGVYLFNSYFMLAYINPTVLRKNNWEGEAWKGTAPETREEQLVSNTQAWMGLWEKNDSRYYGYWGRGMNCLELTPATLAEYSCFVSDMETAGTDNFGNKTGTRNMLVIGGKPVWALKLTESWEERSCSNFTGNIEDYGTGKGGEKGRVDLAKDIYRMTSGGADKPWCTTQIVGQSNGFARSTELNVLLGGDSVNIYDCSQTADLLLQVKFKGRPLKDDISELARPATSMCREGGAILNIAGEGNTYTTVVEWAMTTSVTEARSLLQIEVQRALATSDPVATDWGATSTLLLAVLTTCVAILGVREAFRAGLDQIKDWSKVWAPLLGFWVVVSVALATLTPPIEFLVGEYYSRDNNPNSDQGTAPTVLWTFVKAEGSSGEYQVATAVVVTFKSLTMPLAVPFGISAIIVAALGSIWTAYVVWMELQSWTNKPSPDKPSPDKPWNILRSFVITRWRAKAFTHSYSRHHNMNNDVPTLQVDSLPSDTGSAKLLTEIV